MAQKRQKKQEFVESTLLTKRLIDELGDPEFTLSIGSLYATRMGVCIYEAKRYDSGLHTQGKAKTLFFRFFESSAVPIHAIKNVRIVSQVSKCPPGTSFTYLGTDRIVTNQKDEERRTLMHSFVNSSGIVTAFSHTKLDEVFVNVC